MKTIWILNHYAGNMFADLSGRHYNFAKHLKENGYSPVVFCCNTRHGGKREEFFSFETLWEEHKTQEPAIPFVFIKARTYAGNGADRILNMTDFYFHLKKTAKQYAKQNGNPDVILASSVHPLTLLAGIQLAKHFGVKCICEMRDLWPEAIVAYSKRIKKTSLFAKLLYAGEKWLYKKADALIFTQEGGADYLREQGWDRENGGPIDMQKVFHINNGVDLKAFSSNREKFVLEDEDLDDADTYKVVYTGAIRRINNLGIILDAAKQIKDPRIKFLIWGDGDKVEELKQRIRDEKLENVVFKGFVNKQYIPSVISRADLNLVHWEMTPLLRVGESYNKAFEYFAAGKPVFYTVRPGYSIVEKFQCGTLTDGFAPEDIARGIEKMASLTPQQTQEMVKNAGKAAAEYDFANLTKKLIGVIHYVKNT